jgi:CAAX prenyl protease-like protein
LIDERFSRVPMGTFTFFSFAVVTLLFAVVHPEILAAIVWGAGINGLLYQTRNLWACVVGHGVTNFLLGVYVLQSGHWELW